MFMFVAHNHSRNSSARIGIIARPICIQIEYFLQFMLVVIYADNLIAWNENVRPAQIYFYACVV